MFDWQEYTKHINEHSYRYRDTNVVLKFPLIVNKFVSDLDLHLYEQLYDQIN